jgi:hypothetical protein
MGLDIAFEEAIPEAAGLDRERLASIPVFLNFVRVLTVVLKMLDEQEDEEQRAFLKACRTYTEMDPDAAQRFESYLSFVRRSNEKFKFGLDVMLDPADYSPLARALSAALMLRAEPIDPTEAGEMLEFTRGICEFTRRLARLLPIVPGGSSAVSAAESMVEVFDKYIRCLEIAAERNVAFRIDF